MCVCVRVRAYVRACCVQAKEAQALRQVTANTQVAYQQDIDRINALIAKSSGNSGSGGSGGSKAAAASAGRSRGEDEEDDDDDDEEDVATMANRIELAVFVAAYVMVLLLWLLVHGGTESNHSLADSMSLSLLTRNTLTHTLAHTHSHPPT